MDIIAKPDKIMEEVAVSSSVVPSGDALASALVGGDTEVSENVELAPEDVPDEVELVGEQPSKRKKTTITAEARD
eukprot:1264244-Amphidinium_carterae.1